MNNENVNAFIETVNANPDLPVITLVNGMIANYDDQYYWIGKFGRTEIKETYKGRTAIHFRDDDQVDVLGDMIGCEGYCTADGRDILELSDEEWKALYNSLPWEKCIVLYLEVGDSIISMF